MTRQESFKRRVRERMTKTGERYSAARRVLLDKSSPGNRTWVSEPEMSEEAVRQATGRGWDDWCDLLDAWPGDVEDHSSIVAHVQAQGVSGWWAQSVAVGYERITGRRLKYQQPDGTFTASKSRTVSFEAATLRSLLLAPEDRLDLFPGIETELRSRASSKVVRLRIGPGTAQIALDELSDGRTKVSVAHEKLPTPQAVEEWKAYWEDWLQAIAQE